MSTPRDSVFFARLDAFVATQGAARFDWAGHHCASFVGDWLGQLGHAAPSFYLRGARAAARHIRAVGGALPGVVALLGQPLAGGLAWPGDVALVRVPRSRGRHTLVLGLCVGAHVLAPGASGLLALPITEAEAAWRV
jgi:hypothetical protein